VIELINLFKQSLTSVTISEVSSGSLCSNRILFKDDVEHCVWIDSDAALTSTKYNLGKLYKLKDSAESSSISDSSLEVVKAEFDAALVLIIFATANSTFLLC
jgi:hypothetical protein